MNPDEEKEEQYSVIQEIINIDPQRLADLHHRVEGRTSDAVVQRTVDGR